MKKIICALLTLCLLTGAFCTAEEGVTVSVGVGESVVVTPELSAKLSSDFESSDPAVLTVDENGNITPVGAGTAYVTAKTLLNGAVAASSATLVTVSGDAGTDEEASLDGVTTFAFDGKSVTVAELGDTKYEIYCIRASDEEEGAPDESEDADGSKVYTLAEGFDELRVAIKKSGGVYAFSGESDCADICVNKEATGDAVLLLNGLTLTSKITAALTIKKDSEASVTLTALSGTENTLADSAINDADTYGSADDGGDGSNEFYAESAVIKAKTASNLTINGAGTLNILSSSKNGLKSGESAYLTLSGPTLNIDAPNNGVSGENSVVINGGTFNITSGNDGIKASDDSETIGTIVINGGTFNIKAAGDGVTAEETVVIKGGRFTITSGDGCVSAARASSGFGAVSAQTADEPSTKGIKAGGGLTIYGGVFDMNCEDDAFHSNADLTVYGGTFGISTEDDGFHADYILTMGDGDADELSVNIAVCYEGLEGAAVNLYSGKYVVYAYDDEINAANSELRGYSYSINIFGGEYELYTETGDGLDSNGAINISGGQVVAFSGLGSSDAMSNSALDCDGSLNITGGTVLAVGSGAMISVPAGNPSLSYSTKVVNGDKLAIRDTSGGELFSWTAYWASPTSGYYANSVIFSDEALVEGDTYYLYVNDSLASTVTATVGSGSGMSFGGMGGGMSRPGGMVPGGSAQGRPEGAFREMPEGDFPAMPEGDMPEMPEGDFPAMPEGGMPEMPEGDFSAMPEGGMPEMSESGFSAIPEAEADAGVKLTSELPDEESVPAPSSAVLKSDAARVAAPEAALEYRYRAGDASVVSAEPSEDNSSVTLTGLKAGVTTLSISVYAGGTLIYETEYAVTVFEGAFSDVSPESWYYEAVSFASERGLVLGFDDGAFRHGENMTLAQYMTVIYRMGLSEGMFDEYSTTGDDWTEGAEFLNSELGLGFSDLSAEMTRGEMAGVTAAYLRAWEKFEGKTLKTAEKTAFTDISASKYADDIAFMQSVNGVAGYDDGSFRPESTILRREVAQVVYNLLNSVELE